MSFTLSDDHRQVQEMIRRVAIEKVAPRAAEIDAAGTYPQDMFDLLQELGLFTLPFPAEYGGSDSMLSSCVAVEELCRVCYNTAYLLIVQWVPFGAILAGGNPTQQAKYLPGLANGDLRAAISTTEAQSGSDVAGIRTKAERVDGGYRLNGAKIWCTNSSVADFVLIAAKIVEEGQAVTEAKRGAINLFIVERDTPGFTVGPAESKMGARGVPSCPLFLDDAFIPEENRLGEEGLGFKIVMEAFNKSRPIIGARGVGLAQGAMDLSIDFVKQRAAFGQQVSNFQGVRWMIADMAIQTEAARSLVYRAAAMVDDGITGQELAQAAAIAKAQATDTAMTVATDAVQLFGAAGISNDYPINRYFRDAKVLQIVEGTNQIQRNIIANNLIGRS
ncbi:MAG: acyl-CoA dehydrogenase [Rhodospirillaceae bacterium]|nr:acyl-CoA dehydrogenase [Rhodospirillaceae bacterium]MBT4046661.1 acyl-CoA dehydrogenase [Rhodospirillaceae bacterium]MBT4689607.1 acyl-CoA dehydrogenase [Rhodospirillaceae bacterium]MBT5082296.1 acyl-CoA dehydrogenase [Rhodospirillaceae bacterium]MBT5525373.1 acyl-CoA dehydrogenase [Rhodospirillaceae bacterium]